MTQGVGNNYSVIITTTHQIIATQNNTIVGIDYGDTITHAVLCNGTLNATETIDVKVYTPLGRLGVLIYDIAELFRSPMLRFVIAIASILIVIGLLMFIVSLFDKIAEQIGKVGKG